MIVEAILIPLIISKLRGGSFKKLLEIYINKWWLITIAGLIEAIATFIRAKEIGSLWIIIDSHILWIHLLTYGLLIATLMMNIRQKGILLLLIGTLLNFLVIILNGGRMPVDITSIKHLVTEESLAILSSGKDLTHTLADNTTKLRFLGDIFHLQKPYPFPKSLSIGDFFLIAGIMRFIHHTMLKK